MGNITGEVDRLLFSLPLVAVNGLAEFQISLCEPFSFFFSLFFFFKRHLLEMDVPETRTLGGPCEIRNENAFLRGEQVKLSEYLAYFLAVSCSS